MTECVMTLAPSGESRVFPQRTLIADALLDMGDVFDTPCDGHAYYCVAFQVLAHLPQTISQRISS